MALPPLQPDKPMDGLTRRTLLRASGVVGAGALLAGAAGITLEEVLRRGSSTAATSGTPILVLLSMYGGNDGINTLVPYADPAYHDGRPELAYTADEVLRLDDRFGLNPGLKGMADLWGQRKLAIVRGVGYPRPDHSHFRSMDIWQTGSPERPVSTGWVGRWLDVAHDDPLLAVSIGDVLPPLAVGTKATAAALAVGRSTGPRPSDAVLDAFGRPDHSDTPAAAAVRESYAALTTARTTFAPITAPDPDDDQQGDSGGSATALSPLKTQLDLVARCIKANVPTRVYAVSASGFDTHANEKRAQTGQLTVVDEAVTAFLGSLTGSARERDVVILAYSEFGRRVRANASLGTDHGTAGTAFLIGDRVSGGFHGDQPSLTDLDNGDLKTTTDFRAVYGEILDKTLGTDPSRVLDTVPAALGLLA